MGNKLSLFLLAVLASIPCLGQPFTYLDPAFMCQTNIVPTTTVWCPTNEPYGSGSNLVSWYVGTNYYTNAGIPTLPDSGGKHSYNFTNLASSATWPHLAGNGLIFSLGVDQHLKCANYNQSQPHEIVIVAEYLVVSNAASDYFFYDGAVASHRNFLRHGGGTIGFGYYAGTVQPFMQDLTNQAIMFSSAYNGANSYVTTNKVLATTANPGTQNMDQGMVLGEGVTLTGNSGILFYEMATYSATNGVLSRSNLYYYFKTIKGYPLP